MFSHISRLKRHTEKQLEHYARPTMNFFLLIGLASIIATAGLYLNDTAVIIGAMVVAPLVTPLFGFSLGLLTGNIARALRAILMMVYGTVIAILIASVIAFIVQGIEGTTLLTSEMSARGEPHYLSVVVAFASGIAGAYTYAKKEALASIAGIAMSVAILPPLSVVGIGMISENTQLMHGAFLLYAFNLVGIIFGSMSTFIALGFAKE